MESWWGQTPSSVILVHLESLGGALTYWGLPCAGFSFCVDPGTSEQGGACIPHLPSALV